jgi:nucleotide-binding universal stress UspA family protein
MQSDHLDREDTLAATVGTTSTVPYERIVVPLDGSELAEEALAHAEPLAQAIGAPLHLVRVVDTPSLAHIGTVGLGVEQAALSAALQRIAAEQAAATEYLTEIRERLVPRGLDTTTTVVTGDVVAQLLGAIRLRDLLVMTTHGRTGLARWFFGSVAEAVIRRSPVPVLVVRPVAEPVAVAEADDASP